MTTRECDIAPRDDRPPSYVDRETGAAELRISPETWDKWVAAGTLPAASPNFPQSSPRWRWADVDNKLSGKTDTPEGLDPFLTAVRNGNHGTAKDNRNALA